MQRATFLAIGFFIGGAGIHTVLAEPSSRLAWTPETLAFVKHGNGEKGKQIAESCSSCHAPTQEGSTFPRLEGQLATYLYKQLQDYKHGQRDNSIMKNLVTGLTDQDMADVAMWYSQHIPPDPPSTSNSSAPKEAEWQDKAERLVERGDSERIIPPCLSCHGTNGEGQRVDIPALSRQNPAYLEQTLLDYKTGVRHNDTYGRMRSIAHSLDTEEIKALAHYYFQMKH